MRKKQIIQAIAVIGITISTGLACQTNTFADAIPETGHNEYNSNMQIPVYFTHISAENKIAAKKAMAQWNTKLNRKTFYETKIAQNANIYVTSISYDEYTRANHGNPVAVGLASSDVGVNVVSMFDGWNANKKYIDTPSYLIYEHEFGHTLGLNHATDKSKDVMQAAASPENPITDNDVATAKTVFNREKQTINYSKNQGFPSQSGVAWTYSLKLSNQVAKSNAWKKYYLLTISKRNSSQEALYQTMRKKMIADVNQSGVFQTNQRKLSDSSNYGTFWAKYNSQLNEQTK